MAVGLNRGDRSRQSPGGARATQPGASRDLGDARRWRQGFAVLVPQADAIGMIGVVRSLGRAGYRVHACSALPGALGLRSRYACAAVVHPPYDQPDFLAWLRAYVRDNGIDSIVPSEGFLLAVEPDFDDFASLMPGLPERRIVYQCLSKAEVGQRLLSAPASPHMPPSRVVHDEAPRLEPGELAEFPLPIYVKTDACDARVKADSVVRRASSADEAVKAANHLARDFRKVLVQGSVPGRKACVNICTMNDEIVAESMCLARHENPHTGGITSYRHTWWNQAMRDDALAKIERLGWRGVAMVEYKWNAPTQTFHFIELNARYWAALHLDLYAGTDFPRLQIDRFFGGPTEAVAAQPLGIACRHALPADFGYAASRIRDREVALPSRIWTFLEFFLLFLRPGLKSDLYFPGDRNLYWLQWGRFIGSLLSRRTRDG